jgi:hypothetical protein
VLLASIAHAAQRTFFLAPNPQLLLCPRTPLGCHWTASFLDPEANAREMGPRNRTNNLHAGSPNLLPSTGGIPAAGGTRLVMEGSTARCLDARRSCRHHGSLNSPPSRPSRSLIDLHATHWPARGLASGVGRRRGPIDGGCDGVICPLRSPRSCSARPSHRERRPDEGYKRSLLPPPWTAPSFFLSYHFPPA